MSDDQAQKPTAVEPDNAPSRAGAGTGDGTYVPPMRWTPPDISESRAVLMTIERIAMDPKVSIEKMNQLLNLQERILAANAEEQFNYELAKIQSKFPTVDRRGKITISTKETRNLPKEMQEIGQASPYAKWEDLWEAIKGPLCEQGGFTLTFKFEETEDKRLKVIGFLKRGRHTESTYIILQHESSGSKNPAQAVGSTVTYGKRYVAGMLLNLVSRDIEPDLNGAKIGADKPRLSEAQIAELSALLEKANTTPEPLLAFYSQRLKIEIKTIADLPVDQLEHATKQLKNRIANDKAAADSKGGDRR